MKKMNKKEMATALNDVQYGEEVTPKLNKIAEENGLVIAFTASDDLIEFRGAIEDETGHEVFLSENGILESECQDYECPYFQKMKKDTNKIEVDYADDQFVFSTEIKHETFNVIEGENKYCRGIVFDLVDLI